MAAKATFAPRWIKFVAVPAVVVGSTTTAAAPGCALCSPESASEHDYTSLLHTKLNLHLSDKREAAQVLDSTHGGPPSVARLDASDVQVAAVGGIDQSDKEIRGRDGRHSPIQIMGQYNTGTNLLLALIKNNFPSAVVVDSHHNAYETVTCRFWKHSSLPLLNKIAPSALSVCHDEGAVGLAMVRNPISWLQSMRREGHDLYNCNDGVNWLTKSCHYPKYSIWGGGPQNMNGLSGRIYPNIETVWNNWTHDYENLDFFGFEHWLLIRYEDLVISTVSVLSRIAAVANLTAPTRVQQVNENMSPRPEAGTGRATAIEKIRTRSYIKQFSFKELQQACSRLDEAMMLRHGYSDCFDVRSAAMLQERKDIDAKTAEWSEAVRQMDHGRQGLRTDVRQSRNSQPALEARVTTFEQERWKFQQELSEAKHEKRQVQDKLSAIRGQDKALRNQSAVVHKTTSVPTGKCVPPAGFVCTDGGAEATARFQAEPGNYWNASVHTAEAVQFVELVQKFLKEHHVRVMYDLCVPSYGFLHLFPLFHVLPGEFFSTCSQSENDPLKTFPKVVAERVHVLNVDMFTDMLNNDTSMIAVTGTRWKGVGKVSNPLRMITLSHGDDEDGLIIWHSAAKIRSRAFQDIAYSRYARESCYAFPSAVLGFLREDMAKAHDQAPCLQSSCSGVLVIVLGLIETTQISGNSIDALAQRWKIVLRPHPLWWRDLSTEWQTHYKSLKPHVYFNDPSNGISLLDVLDTADAVLTSSCGALVSALHSNLRLPIVRFGISAVPIYFLHDSVFNASMGVIVSKPEDLTVDAVDVAVQQVSPRSDTVDTVLSYRKDYLRRFLWTTDGFEEYRVAYQILVDSMQANTDLDLLRTSLQAVTKVPPRPLELFDGSYLRLPFTLSQDQQDAEFENRERMKNPLRSFNLE